MKQSFKRLYDDSYEEILKGSESVANFHDLTQVLNTLDGLDHFYDFCHLSVDGNKLIAREIRRLLTDEYGVQF